mmetsp:Transcript_19221/g.24941  ORF Transcript_19221/g.24941 Transcript_19221/m.24941 type:complete len:199 (-) Transcript_19221:159-755(-)
MSTFASFVRGPLQPLSIEEDVDEEILYSLDDVHIYVVRDTTQMNAEEPATSEAGEGREDWGQGLLRVTSRRLIWERQGESVNGMKNFSLDMLLVGLHAATRDPDTFPQPCLYAQLLLERFPPSPTHPSELFLVPRNADNLSDLFEFVSKAAALNPDFDDDLDHDHLITAEDIIDDDQEDMLRRFDSMLSVPTHLKPPV